MRRKNVTVDMIGEDVSLREPHAKHYRMSDGSYQAFYMYDSMHYKGKDGRLHETDNRLFESKRNLAIQEDFDGFETVGNDINIKFGSNVKEAALMRMEKDGAELTFFLPVAYGFIRSDGSQRTVCNARIGKKYRLNDKPQPDATKSRLKALRTCFKQNGHKLLNENIALIAPEHNTGEIYYDNAYDNADIQYIIKNGAVKENIIIKERRDNYEFEFIIKIKNLTAKLSDDKKTISFSKEGKSVFEIPAPNMRDASGRYSESIYYKLDEVSENSVTTLKVIADKEWINSAETVFPVTIDPSVLASSDNYSDWVKIDGKNDATGSVWQITMFDKLNFNILPTIDSAKFNSVIFCLPRYSVRSGATLLKAKDNRGVSPIYTVCANTDKTEYKDSEQICDFRGYDIFDITESMEYNRLRYFSNYFEISKLSGHTYYAKYPMMQVNYTRTDSISHETLDQNVMRAGIGAIDLYTGELKFKHTDVSLSGDNLPLNLEHIYCSGNDDSSSKIGKNWRLNLNQTVKEESSGNTAYYVYISDANRKIIFSRISDASDYEDESGIGLKYYPAEKRISDKNGSSLHFNSSGYLCKITDNNNKALDITVDGGGTVTGVADGAGRIWTLTYETVGGYVRLKQMQNNLSGYAAEKIEYAYLNNDLKEIKYYKNGVYEGSTAFEYIGGVLTKVTDQTGYTVEYTFKNGKYDEIKSYATRENITNNGLGKMLSTAVINEAAVKSKQTIDYADKFSTIVSDANGKSVQLFDENGITLTKYSGDVARDATRTDFTPIKVTGQFVSNFSGYCKGEDRNSNRTSSYSTSKYDRNSGRLDDIMLPSSTDASAPHTVNILSGADMVFSCFTQVDAYPFKMPSPPLENEYVRSDSKFDDGSRIFGVPEYKIEFLVNGTVVETAYINPLIQGKQFVSVPLSKNVLTDTTLIINFVCSVLNSPIYFWNIKLEENKALAAMTETTVNTETGGIKQISKNNEASRQRANDGFCTTVVEENLKTSQKITTKYFASTTEVVGAGGSRINKTGRTETAEQWDNLGNFMSTHTRKTEDWNYPGYFWDERFLGYEDSAHTFEYDTLKDELKKEIYPGGQEINYTYGQNFDNSSAAVTGGYNGITTENVKKTYTAGLLTSLENDTSVYSFVYDGYSRLTEISKSEPKTSAPITIIKKSYRSDCNYATASSNESLYNYIMITDALGNTKKVIFDRFGNEIKTYIGTNNAEPTMLAVSTNIDYINETVTVSDIQSGITEKSTKADNGNTTYSALKGSGSAAENIESAYTLRSDKQLVTKTLTTTIGTTKTDFTTIYGYRRPAGAAADFPETELAAVEITEGNTTRLKSTYTDYALGTPRKRQVGNNLCSNLFNEEYTRLSVGGYNNKEKLTDFISQHKITIGSGVKDFNYAYDNNGNIKEITRSGNNVKYSYDGANRLIREDNQRLNTTTVWRYDARGNIVSKVKYPYSPAGSINYESDVYLTLPANLGSSFASYAKPQLSGGTAVSYGYAANTDKLISHNGVSLGAAYDSNGRPDKWLIPKAGIRALAWNRENLSKISDVNGYDYEYGYDAKGKRISKAKKLNGVVSEASKYYYEGNELVHEIRGNDKFWYLYDTTGIAGFVYQNNSSAKQVYYLVKNIQGDILNIVDQTGNQVAEYVYDAWGNHKVLDANENIIGDNTVRPQSMASEGAYLGDDIYACDGNYLSSSLEYAQYAEHIGNVNPFRYRGYYYDRETGLYYLNSRYADGYGT